MRKNDRQGLRDKVLKFWESGQADQNAAFGLTYARLPEICPYNPVAYLLQCVSLYDAIRKWAAQRVEPYGLEPEEIPAAAQARRKCAKAICFALGRYRHDYDAAENAMDDYCSEARSKAGLISGNEGLRPEFVPVMIPVWEINRTLRTLLEAYRNPKTFFSEVAPRLFPSDFDISRDDWQRLAGTLRTWKYGALLNRNVRAAFDAAAENPPAFAKVLGQADRRTAYVEGRRKGRKDSKPRLRRVDVGATKADVYRLAEEIEEQRGESRRAVALAILEKARREGVKPSTIKRRMTPRNRKK